MEPISNADRLILLLRQKLEERAKTAAGARPAGNTRSARPAEPIGIRGLAALEGADSPPLRRAVIQNLLADQLGPSLLNDAQFQQIVSRVTDAIEEDPDAAQLLSRVIGELRPT